MMKYIQWLSASIVLMLLSALAAAQDKLFEGMDPPPVTGVIQQINHEKKLAVLHDDIYRLSGGMVVYAAPDSLIQIAAEDLTEGARVAYLYEGTGAKRTIHQVWLLPASAGEEDHSKE
jgi:Cu/Ag efflux protein CusF